MNANPAWLQKDFYKVLGVAENASAADIKRAYRKLAQKHHPDRNPGNSSAEESMKDASEAYDVLSDPEHRSEYDKVRKMARSGFGSPGGFTGTSFRVDDFGADLGDLFGGLFGGGGGPRRRPAGGPDLESEVGLSFDDAMRGTTVALHVPRDVACETCRGTGAAPGTVPSRCPTCEGSGIVGDNQGFFSVQRTCKQCRGTGQIVDKPCKTCRGEGTVRRTDELKVRIPAGVRDGARIRVRGRGGAGERGASAGDLYVVVHVASHPLFGRRESDLTLELPITFPEAALGAQIKVPTLTEPVTLKIPAGTQDGKTFRVKGRGAPKAKGGAGDLLITVRLRVPEKLSKEERELVRGLAEKQNGSIRSHLGVS